MHRMPATARSDPGMWIEGLITQWTHTACQYLDKLKVLLGPALSMSARHNISVHMDVAAA